MTEFFYSLEQEYNQYMAQAHLRMTQMSQKPHDQKENYISDTRNDIRSIEQCIKQMEVEINPLPEQKRRELNQKIRGYRGDYDEARKKFMKLEEDYLTQKNKEVLLGKRDDIDTFAYNGDSIVERQNRNLTGAKKTAYEALEIADDTSTRLQSQTETLTRSGERLKNTRGMLDESRVLIKDMQDAIFRNKMRMYIVFGFIALAVIIIIVSYLI